MTANFKILDFSGYERMAYKPHTACAEIRLISPAKYIIICCTGECMEDKKIIGEQSEPSLERCDRTSYSRVCSM